MTQRLTWLPDVLRAAGVDVWVMPGAETRTTRASGLSPLGIVWHHTATGPNWSDTAVAALLRDGRRDLPGPLAQVGIERDGTWVIVALGRANHNGYGTWGNDSIGLEFYNSGTGERWPLAQVQSGVIGSAAILRHLKQRAATAVKGHRETDPKRKIDPAGLNMTTIRQRIDAEINGGDDMPLTESDLDAIAARVWNRTIVRDGVGMNAPAVLVIGDIFHHARKAAAAQGADIDEAAVAQEILAHLDATKIAAAIPEDLAAKVADELSARLQS